MMENQYGVIGFTTNELIESMAAAGIHCSLDRFRRLAIEIQRRALVEQTKEEKEEK